MPKIDGRALDHSLSEHLRIMAVRRVVEDGEIPSVVIESMGLNRTTIYRWLATYEEKGYEGLKSSKAEGPAPSLSEEQCQQVRNWIIGKDPRQYGFDFGLWTRKIIQLLIKERFAVEVKQRGHIEAELFLRRQFPVQMIENNLPRGIFQQSIGIGLDPRGHGAHVIVA